jgi:hypothetical protein
VDNLTLTGIADLPPVPHVYFHWARRQWIVWLHDPVYNQASQLRRSSGDPFVVEADGGWRLRFPPTTQFLTVSDILVTNPMVLVGQDGQEVLPAIPVKSEFMDLVLCKDNPSPARRVAETLSCDFELVGGVQVEPSFPMRHLQREERLHLEIWPNVQGADWKAFWCGVETDNPEELAGIASRGFVGGSAGHYAVAEESSGANDPSGHHGPGYWVINGRPRLIWLGDHAHAGGCPQRRTRGSDRNHGGTSGGQRLASWTSAVNAASTGDHPVDRALSPRQLRRNVRKTGRRGCLRSWPVRPVPRTT